MRLLDFFFARHHDDSELGRLTRGWGCWRGTMVLGAGPAVPLVLPGWGTAPDPLRVSLARGLPARYAGLRPAIGEALFEHYAPYADAVAAGEEDPGTDLPRLSGPDEVWAHVTVVRVSIERQGGVETIEIACRVSWDREHTLGARIQGWSLVELNGSVLA